MTYSHPLTCLVTGATGYVGGRLVPELLAAGFRVRCMARSAERLQDFPWIGQVEVAEADAADRDAVRRALADVDVAYYLIHALGSGPGFEETDRRTARIFAEQADAAGTGRIVYLGGLQPSGSPEGSSRQAGKAPWGSGGSSPGASQVPAGSGRSLSPHLRSRTEVGEILLASGVPAAVLRAGVIIGAGSASFEMLRYLTERLPVMVTPKWVGSRIQPIAIRDVLSYLVGCARLPGEVSRAFDIGGPDVLTYAQMMQRYAAAAGLRPRIVLPVGVLTPSLSSHWVGLVTPVPSALARPLVESLRHDMVARERDIEQYVPDPPGGLISFDDSVRLALKRVRQASVATRWSAPARPGAPSDPLPTDPGWAGGSLYTDLREYPVAASPEALWTVIEGIGGEHGWYSFPLAWMVRGWLDTALGGVGLHRGRRDPNRLRAGEVLDFWRVERIVPGQLLRLRAEMKLPGLAWLEMSVHSPAGRTVYRQRALFHPRGLAGHAYWHVLAPFHAVIFGGMSRNVALAAEHQPAAAPSPSDGPPPE